MQAAKPKIKLAYYSGDASSCSLLYISHVKAFKYIMHLSVIYLIYFYVTCPTTNNNFELNNAY